MRGVAAGENGPGVRAQTVGLTVWALLGFGVSVAVSLAFNPVWWITAATTATLTISGLALTRGKEQRITGYLLMAAAGAVNLINLRFWASPNNILDEVAYVSQWAPLPFLALAYLTYPEGSPWEPPMRRFFLPPASGRSCRGSSARCFLTVTPPHRTLAGGAFGQFPA